MGYAAEKSAQESGDYGLRFLSLYSTTLLDVPGEDAHKVVFVKNNYFVRRGFIFSE